MFWANQYSSPQIETILAKEDLTLNELFDQECLFQELKSTNMGLIDFITRSEVLSELVKLVTEEPSKDLDEKERYRLPNLACEVLTTDTPVINEKLSDKLHLSKLYSFLESDPPLNPLLASFVSRTLSVLICRKHDQHWYSYQYTCLQVLDFLKSQTKSLDLLIKHMGTSAIMELMLKLLTQIEGPDLQKTLINLLEHERLIENLMSLFDPSVDEDRQYNVSALLCETIYKGKEDLNISFDNKMRDIIQILDMIQSPAMVDTLLRNVFGEEVSESSMISGIAVLLALLNPPPSPNQSRRDLSDGGSWSGTCTGDPVALARHRSSLHPILTTILPYLPRFHDLLLNPPKRCCIKLASGSLDPPLGQARLSIVKLLATLISTNTPEINAKLDELNTLQLLLDLFFQYTWNNFLHSQVEKCLAIDLNSSNFESAQSNPLVPNIYLKCKIMQRILDAWEENEEEQKKGNRRRGYMGHLINIANNVVKQSENESLGRFISANLDETTVDSWKNFVSNTLDGINNVQNRCLGGIHPSQIREDQENSVRGAFEVTQEIELLKLQEGEFSQPEMMFDSTYKCFQGTNKLSRGENMYLSAANYHLSMQDDVNSDSQEASLFNKICSNKASYWHELPDSRELSIETASNSSDEEEKEYEEDNEDWSPCNSGSGLMESSNPWGKESLATTDPDEGWANFDSNFGNYSELAHGPPPLPTSPPPVSEDVGGRVSEVLPEEADEEPPQLFQVPETNDNNANVNESSKTDSDDELIDNFRFLSKGMITKPEEAPEKTLANEVGKDIEVPESAKQAEGDAKGNLEEEKCKEPA